MFKSTVAILLLSLFILTQYGRQAAYLQCKVENFANKKNTQTCDCEKSNDNTSSTDDKLPAPKTHFHASLDEYYVLNENDHTVITNDQTLKFSNPPVTFISSFNGNIFHPPQL